MTVDLGSGIAVYGNATDASYSISIDNSAIDSTTNTLATSSNLLASINNLTKSDHTLTFTAHTSNTDSTQSFVVFDKALITSQPPNSTASIKYVPLFWCRIVYAKLTGIPFQFQPAILTG